MDTFVALDFETAKQARHTACAVGIVKVVKGVIVQKFYSLIKPPLNEYDIHTMAVHGMNPDHTANAPTFTEIYPYIRLMINKNNVVCHNAAFDISVLKSCIEHYCIDADDLKFDVSDTMISSSGITTAHAKRLSPARAMQKPTFGGMIQLAATC